MLKVAILDDYQNVSQQFFDLEKLSGKYEFKIFNEAFSDEEEAIRKVSRLSGYINHERKDTNYKKFN